MGTGRTYCKDTKDTEKSLELALNPLNLVDFSHNIFMFNEEKSIRLSTSILDSIYTVYNLSRIDIRVF